MVSGRVSVEESDQYLDADDQNYRREVEKTATEAEWWDHPAKRQNDRIDDPVEENRHPGHRMIAGNPYPGEDDPDNHCVQIDLKQEYQ